MQAMQAMHWILLPEFTVIFSCYHVRETGSEPILLFMQHAISVKITNF